MAEKKDTNAMSRCSLMAVGICINTWKNRTSGSTSSMGAIDYVVLQEHSHPFDCIPEYREVAEKLVSWVREAGSTPIIYGTWSMKEEKTIQEYRHWYLTPFGNVNIVTKT